MDFQHALPHGWETTRLDRVATVNARIGWKALTASEYQPDGYAFLATPNIKDPEIDFTNVNYISEFRYNESPELKLQIGDVLLAKDGNTLGVVNIVRRLPRAATVNGSIAVLRSFNMEPRFLRYVLQSNFLQSHINAVKDGMGVPHLFQRDIKRFQLPAPPTEEQRRIADFLDAETARIDRLMQLRRTQVASLEERYSTAISELTTPGISTAHTRNSTWPWLPEQLATARLGYLARVQSGVTVHGARAQDSEDATFPYLRVANVQGERLDLTEIKEITIPRPMAMRSMLQPGDVVMTEANGNPDNLGRGAVWHGQVANMVHQNHVFAIRVDREKLIPEYLSALLAASHGRRYFRFTSTQVGIATTSSSKVLDFPVPVRTISHQAAIVSEYESLKSAADRTRSALTRQLCLLAERRQALITAAVTGQLDVSTASGRNVTEGVTA
ncbi:restriction endonuclease subunit S [Streptomyces thermodiastaticus]|uniref:restriction endonuclease subunit S n=1 Tax=Streptomyces thermodiastaticus TaxID=44061 RepID=UPI001E5452C8|nr:restriction endonuclease subunit S [Streptomyces thermodiastaticus]MCE7548881.1 restriction endonuclease subunit S [Streptomyces thermodiastaticus]